MSNKITETDIIQQTLKLGAMLNTKFSQEGLKTDEIYLRDCIKEFCNMTPEINEKGDAKKWKK